jgi:membrane protein
MGKTITRIREAFERGRYFVTMDIWDIGKPGEEIPSGFFIRQIRVVILLLTKLLDGHLMLRASALTFATLLSIVPFLAVTFYIIQTFNLGDGLYANLQEQLEDFIVDSAEKIPGLNQPQESEEEALTEDATLTDAQSMPPVEIADTPPPEADATENETGETEESDSIVGTGSNQKLQNQLVQSMFQGVGQQEEGMENPVEWLVDLSNSLASLADEAAKNKAAFGISTILLIFTTVFGLMRNIEKAFNSVWGVRRTRSWYRMMSDYLVITLAIPFITAGVLGISAALQSERIREALGPMAILLQTFQFSIVVLLFTSLYLIVPNTRVRFGYATFGGVIAALLWILLSWSYIHFQIGLAKYQAVLSVFAQFPMLLMWVYLSWAILLFGSEITYAYQNEKTFTMERFADKASFAYRAALGLRAMIDMGRRFQDNLPSLQVEAAALEWNVPSRLIIETLEQLEDSGFITECATEQVSYQPARPLDQITAGDILRSLHERGEDPSRFLHDDAYRSVFDEYLNPSDAIHATTIQDLIQRIHLLPKPSDAADAG